MTKARRSTFGSVFSPPALAAALIMLSGCGGANFASELSARPKPRVLDSARDATLELPEQEPFSITHLDSTKNTELDGSAAADAHVDRTGSADATADVTNGGAASGSFQLGHAFRNDSDRQLDLSIAISFHYETNVDAVPPAGAAEALVGLKLYARDHRNMLVRNDDLLNQTAEQGPGTRQGDSTHNFVLTLGPGQSASVFLGGQASVEAAYGRSGACSLKLSNVRMQVKSRSAPAVRTAGDEPG